MMRGHGKSVWDMAAWILVLIGALNWGLVGLGGFFGGNWNVVNLIFGSISWLEYIVYILVGLAGLLLLFGDKLKMSRGGGGQPSQPGGEVG